MKSMFSTLRAYILPFFMRTVHLNRFYGMVLTEIICSFSFINTSRSNAKEKQKEFCLLCEQPSNETYPLHRVHTFPLDQRVRRRAHLLNNCNLHTKLQQVDMIAQDAMYHDNCLIELCRTAHYKLNSQRDITLSLKDNYMVQLYQRLYLSLKKIQWKVLIIFCCLNYLT